MTDIDGIKAEMRRLSIAGAKATVNQRKEPGSHRKEIRHLFPYPGSEEMPDSWTCE